MSETIERHDLGALAQAAILPRDAPGWTADP